MAVTGMKDDRVELRIARGVASVTLCRPDEKNALSRSMYAALADAFIAADRDDAVRVVVLRGMPGAFATGGDLKEILDGLRRDPASLLDYEDSLPFEALRALRKPAIAAIDGLCLGGGLTLALMCDCLIATDRSRFAMPEAKLGIVDGHLSRLLRQTVPPARLRYWMYTGAMFSADEARQVGLLTQMVPESAFEETLEKMIDDLKSSSAEAICQLKAIFNEDCPVSSMTDAYRSMMRPDVRDRLEAFFRRTHPAD